MRDFYKQTGVSQNARFYAACAICGKKHYGSKLPLLCRTANMPELLENGRAGKIRRCVYNKSFVSAVQVLAGYFNLCRSCGSWVCDKCFVPEKRNGICITCNDKINKKGGA